MILSHRCRDGDRRSTHSTSTLDPVVVFKLDDHLAAAVLGGVTIDDFDGEGRLEGNAPRSPWIGFTDQPAGRYRMMAGVFGRSAPIGRAMLRLDTRTRPSVGSLT